MLDWLTRRVRGLARLPARSRRTMLLVALIVVPALALGYLGVRSLRTERAAQRLYIQQTHEQLTALAATRLDASLALVENDLRGSLAARLEVNRAESPARALAELRAEDERLELAILLDLDGGVVYPRRASAAAASGLQLQSTGTDGFEDSFASAERAELRDRILASAVDRYRAALAAAVTAAQRVRAYNGLGRTELKLGNPEAALDAYDRLIAEADPADPLQAGLGLIAHSQRARCLESLGLDAEVAVGTLEMLRYLVKFRALMDPDVAEFYAGDLRSFDPGPEAGSSFADAFAAGLQQLERARSLDEPYDVALSALSRGAPSLASGPGNRRLAVSGGDPVLIALVSLPEGFVLAIPWTRQRLAELLTPLAGDVARPLGLELAVRDSVGAAMATTLPDGSWDASASSALPGFPAGWSLSAHPVGDSLDTLIERQVQRQVAVLALVAVVVIAAVGLAARSVAHEMAVSRLRSEFVSSVSHELRTPLSLIRMFVESLEEGWIDPGEREATYRKIRRETDRLSGLIGNVLDFAKVESGDRVYAREAGNLVRLVREVTERYRPQAEAAGVALELAAPAQAIVVDMDRESMDQVLVNLLSNALKYIGEGERRVAINVSRTSEQGIFSVTDSGIGIEESERRGIWRRFTRASDPRVRAVAGSGIGLAVAQAIVGAHEGTIEVQSRPGHGSCFTVRLPLRDAPLPLPEAAPGAAQKPWPLGANETGAEQ